MSSINNNIKVCKKAFVSINGVTEGRVRRLCDLITLGKSPKDNRGKHPKANTKSPEICFMIHEHILSFPRKKTHYSGKEIEYLDARLDIKIMHGLFVKKYPQVNVNYKYYLKYFKENFSIRFGRPQVDTCITCEQLNVKIKSPSLADNVKRTYVAELMVHKRRAKKFHNKMASIQQLCKERQDVMAITFDFMQNLPLPNIPVQDIFYLRQLWVNCFGIKNLKTEESTFYMYHEGEACKGSNDVCSMLLDYINNNISSDIKELYFFCDGCPGQNKNNTVIRFLLALTDSQRFERVYHFFPVRGHTFLPNDRDFGVIKKKIRKHDRIYVPDEYIKIVNECSEKFKVIKFQTNQVYDFKKWWPSYYKKTCLSVETFGKKVPKDQKHSFSPSTYMSFEYNTKYKGTVFTQNYIDGLSKHTFKLLKLETNNNIILPTVKVYNNKVPINPKKIENLKQVEDSIIEEHRLFYEEIYIWPTTDEQNMEAENVEFDGEYDYVP